MTVRRQDPAHEPNRRRMPRRQPAQGTTCLLATGDGEGFGTGLVWNISQSGVSMLLPTLVEPGTELRANLVAADGVTLLPIALRVAHIAQLRTGDYFLGAQFQRPITAEEMKPFISSHSQEEPQPVAALSF